MKVISKRIARNEFVSRKNGVIPSLMDTWIVSSVSYDCDSSSTAKKYVYNTYSSAVQKANELKELGVKESANQPIPPTAAQLDA